MYRFTHLRALAVQALLLLSFSLFFSFASAEHSTVITTSTSTTIIGTSTTTITQGGSTSESITTTTQGEVVTTTISPGAPSQSSSLGGYTGPSFPSAVLNSTNFFRQQHEASPLSWDSTLAAFAQSHAQKCIWEHSGGPYGENLAENFAIPALAIDAWAAEESKYNYGKRKFSEKTGHYTQLVWQNTTHVGCGAVECNSNAEGAAHGWFLVCEYSPRGNVAGEYGTNVRKAGQDAAGRPGFGNSASIMSASRWILAMAVAMSSVAAACL